MNLFKYVFNQFKYLLCFFIGIYIFFFTGHGEINFYIINKYISSIIGIGYLACFTALLTFYNLNLNNFYKRIALGFITVGFFFVLRDVWFDLPLYESTINQNLYIKLEFLLKICAGLTILNSLYKNLEEDKSEINLKVIVWLVLLFVFVVVEILITTNIIPNVLLNSREITRWYYVFQAIIIVIFIACIDFIVKSKDKLGQRCFYDLLSYVTLNILFHLLLCIPFKGNADVISYYIRPMALMPNFFIFKILIFDIIRKPNEMLYKELLDKNNMLEDALRQLEQSQNELGFALEEYKRFCDLVPVGIVVFVDNKLSYTNKAIEEMFEATSYSNFIGLEKSSFEPFVKFNNKCKENKHKHNNYKLNSMGTQCILTYNDININADITTKIIHINGKQYELSVITNTKLKDELKEKKRQIELIDKKNEIKNQLLANISHEFKTPVNVIYSSVQMQKEYILQKNLPEIGKYNDYVTNNCNRLIKLINNFIDSIKYENDNIKNEVGCFNIVPIIENVTLSIIPYAKSKNINVIFDTDEEVVYCNINIDLMDRAMLNLLSNAIKYNRKNGNIEVVISSSKCHVQINVIDSGVGISKEKTKLLFDRFERLDPTLSRSCEGSGLGLNITKSIIKNFNGKITVSSKKDIGSIFSIVLPVTENIDCESECDNIDDNIMTSLDRKVQIEMSDIY